MTDTEERTRCPHCAEMILRAAKVCRFCGRRVDQPIDDHVEPQLPPGFTAQPKAKKSNAGKWIVAGIFVLILIAALTGKDDNTPKPPPGPSLHDAKAGHIGNLLTVTSPVSRANCKVEVNDTYTQEGMSIRAGETTFLLTEFAAKDGRRFSPGAYKLTELWINCRSPDDSVLFSFK